MTIYERVEERKLLHVLLDEFWGFTGKISVEALNPTELGYYNKIITLFDQNTQAIRDELDLV